MGIYGGTFDPVHHGHLRPALEVMEALALGEVCFVPNGRPPHRDSPGCTAEQRLQMLQAALAGQPGFSIDERELGRAGPSWTVDTLEQIRAEQGARPLCLIMGMDAFLGLPEWHRWQDLLALAHLVVMRRPGWKLPRDTQPGRLLHTNAAASKRDLHQQPAGLVLLQTVTPLDISATRIRALVAAGHSPRFLLPDPVWRLIGQQHYYGMKQ